MEQHRKVKTIPATLTRFTSAPITEQKKRRVAGYARVSTDHDEQFTSYEAQIDYYTRFIQAREDWEFVQVYTDEGIFSLPNPDFASSRQTGSWRSAFYSFLQVYPP